MESKVKDLIYEWEASKSEDGEWLCMKIHELLWSNYIYDTRWHCNTFAMPMVELKVYAFAWNDKDGLHLVDWTVEIK